MRALLLYATLLLTPVCSFSQINKYVNNFFITKQLLSRDSAGIKLSRNDSLDVNILIHFSAIAPTVQQIYLQIGPSQNSAIILSDTLDLITSNNRALITSRSLTPTAQFSNNMVLTYRLPFNTGLMWGTLFLKDAQNVTSVKKYCQVN